MTTAQPSGQTCTVTSGSGTISGGNVTNVAVTCADIPPGTYTVGGSVSGLTGTGLVLQNNGGDNLPVSAGATLFTFTTPIDDGATYNVTVSTQPSGQTCSVTNSSGTISGANVTNIAVTCVNDGGGGGPTLQWTVQSGISGEDWGYDIAVDLSGNVYVTGLTYGGLDGNTNNGSYDIFITKYDTNGSRLWTVQPGTSSDDYGRSIAVDSNGNVYATGYTDGGLDGNTSNGGDDICITKYAQ